MNELDDLIWPMLGRYASAMRIRGKPLRAMQNRLTWGLRTSGHVLRIVHEHTSAPLGFEDQKAILHKTRPPADAGSAGGGSLT
ncbi:MAG: hypothetical protein M3Y67_07400 [Pseudomonadota bacterium]|nr:hypothetical protein [Pseudomonadota bacterium]